MDRENYKGVPDREFPLMDPVNYPLKCTGATVGPSKSSGNDVWTLMFEVEGPKFAGRKLWLFVTMKPDFASMRKNVWRAFGYDVNSDRNFHFIDDAIGRKCIGRVYLDEYQGEKREKLKYIKPIGDRVQYGDIPGSDEIPF